MSTGETMAPSRNAEEVEMIEPEVVRQMLDHLDELRRAGRAVIED